MSSQKWRPQKSSSDTAWWTAESQKLKSGREELVDAVRAFGGLAEVGAASAPASMSRRCELRRQDATTMRMKGSECRTLSTTQAGQPLVWHQSRSSAVKHWSQEKAPRAAPRKAISRSKTERGEERERGLVEPEWWERVWAAKKAAWERIWRMGSRREWRMSRWRMKVYWVDWSREE
jgi:hypothetical protein